jgi:hypothetical protein
MFLEAPSQASGTSKIAFFRFFGSFLSIKMAVKPVYTA